MTKCFESQRYCVRLLWLLSTLVAPAAVHANFSADEDFVWNNGLRESHFGEREIIESEDIISLKAPKLAEDPSLVPIKVTAAIRQTEAHYIKNIFIVIDQNPSPMAGRFHFTPKSGRADLALRVRVNAYTPVRAIAETNDGKLYMSKRFVRASGGCSVPVNADLTKALERAGKMKLRTHSLVMNQPSRAALKISHPNLSGMQIDRESKVYLPSRFVRSMKVDFNGELVMTAETDFSISTDPSFSFFFVPDRVGELTVEIEDSEDHRYSQSFVVAPD